MGKEIFDWIKDESKYAGLLFLSALIIFKIIYFKESFIVLLRYVASLFWLFALPGYFIMLHWRKSLNFAERTIVGIALSAAIIGISSYYLGIIGLNIKYHAILLPLAIIGAGFAMGIYRDDIS